MAVPNANIVTTAALSDNNSVTSHNGNKQTQPDKQTLLAVLQFLKKNDLKGTEELLKREAGLSEDDILPQKGVVSDDADMSQALAAYKSEGDPTLYSDYYNSLKGFIESCLDVHKVELSTILHPVFVHMYLELVYNGHEGHAINFFQKFHGDQDSYYQLDLARLSLVTKAEHMKEEGNSIMETYKASKFVIKMSRDSYNHLKRHLQEKKIKPLLNIVQEHLFIDVFDGVPRSKQQIEAAAGSVLGESEREANKTKVYYGLLKEPDINIPIEEEEEPADSEDKPKKKKTKKDPLLLKKSKNDPNAPSNTRIPLPELKDADKLEKINAFREALKRVKITANNLPSICFYTINNSFMEVCCIEVSEDSNYMAVGFSNSKIRIFSLSPNKLRSMKKDNELSIIDKEADDVLERMMDDKTATESKTLHGHNGPVYSLNFSQDKKYLISCSEDGTIRLWSLLTWTNLVCYKGHNASVWDVKFSPLGHYFASAGHDRTARLWSTDHSTPLRVFAGHLADVDCIQFHPNCNYIASGSSDRVVRIWDNLTGNCVRTLTGHKGAIHCLCFSPDGRFLASSGIDTCVILWDISSGSQLAAMKGHTEPVYSLAFTRDSLVLASGGLDCCIKLWDIARVLHEIDVETDLSIPSNIIVNENPKLLIGSFGTKCTPVFNIHFTRRNLLIASGQYNS